MLNWLFAIEWKGCLWKLIIGIGNGIIEFVKQLIGVTP